MSTVITLPGKPQPKQEEFFLADTRHVGYGGSRGGGKGSPLTTKVLTPFGFRRMGDLSVGEDVTNPDGTVAKIIQIHPLGTRDVYRVTFDGKFKVECTFDHLWLVKYPDGEQKVLSLEEIIKRAKTSDELYPRVPRYNPWNTCVSAVQITGIDLIPQEECQCITVDHPNGLYVTEDFIVTHNSWALRRKMVLRRLMYPGSVGILFRRTYPELQTNHILPLQMELHTRRKDAIAKYNTQEHVFKFINGSMLFMGYCDKDIDVLRYQGNQYDDIGLEEATMFTEFQMDFLRTCLRTVRTDLKPAMYYTANPGGVGHLWFKRLFIDKNYTEQENPFDYTFIPAKVYDNKILMENDPTYIEELKRLPDDLRRAFLDGDWDVFAGQYFKSFRRDIHTVEPFDIPPWWTRFRSLDYGLDMTACYWHALDNEGNVITYRELYESNLNLSQAAKKILEMTPADEDIRYTVASPDLWNRQQQTGVAGQEIMYEAGLKDLQPADHSRVPGWRLMTEYLEPYYDPNTQMDTAKWRMFTTCKNLIRTLPALVHDDNNPDDVSERGEDHGAESSRYALMSRPIKAKVPEKEKSMVMKHKEKVAKRKQGRGPRARYV